jgi:hypothetical protein
VAKHPSNCLCGPCVKRWQAKQDRKNSGGGQRRSSRGSRSDRSFPANNGTVDGRTGYVQQSGDRTVAYSGPNNVGKVATNDGENASYFRNDDGHVVVNDAAEDPYNSDWNAH